MWCLAHLLAMPVAAAVQLSLTGAKCGQLTCQFDEYCSPETNWCSPCAVVCNQTHHNYDSGLCLKECQGYFLDLRYARRSDSPAPSEDLTSIHRKMLAALIMSGVALAVLALLLIIGCRSQFSWLYIKQKFQPAKKHKKKYPTDLIHHNPHTSELPMPKNELCLQIQNPDPTMWSQPLSAKELDTKTHTEKSCGATTPMTNSTALSNRHPAEDTTLDYTYDNMAMNVIQPEQSAISQRF